MLNGKFSPWPSYTKEEARAVSDVLLSNKVNYWTGEEARKFEEEFATLCNVKHAVALANGTLALEAALWACGLGKGDEVIVTSRTFIASVSAIVSNGAKPIFVDINRCSQNIDPEKIECAVTEKTKMIMCVHLAGWPCDMDPIMDIAKKKKLFVVEDCAQAHGAKYKGKPVGSIGDVGAWSFCQDKIITTGGEGGMITTNNSKLWSKIWSYKDHGKSWKAVYGGGAANGFRWVHESFGTNLRMTELQAKIGRLQLARLNGWNLRRQAIAEKIWRVARKFPKLRVPETRCNSCDCHDKSSKACVNAAYKCYVFVNDGFVIRDAMIKEINLMGVPCFSGSCSEVYLENAFVGTGLRPKRRLNIARELGEQSLMFLCHPTLTKKEVELTCKVLSVVASKHVSSK